MLIKSDTTKNSILFLVFPIPQKKKKKIKPKVGSTEKILLHKIFQFGNSS